MLMIIQIIFAQLQPYWMIIALAIFLAAFVFKTTYRRVRVRNVSKLLQRAISGPRVKRRQALRELIKVYGEKQTYAMVKRVHNSVIGG